MSNRILAFLVLFGVIAAFFLIYIYFFVYYTATITIRSNVEGYSVELFGKSVAQSLNYDCPETQCNIPDISPIEYNMTISKEGYESFFQNIDIGPSSTQEIIVTLQKKVTLEKSEEPQGTRQIQSGKSTVGSGSVTPLSPQDKIAQIRLEKTFDRLFPLSSGNQIGLKDKDFQIELYYIINQSERIIDTFDKESLSISVKEIDQTPYLFIGLNQNKYLYDTGGFSLSELEFTPNIEYIKQGRVTTELLFVTDKGTFVYSLANKQFSYFYFFRDFVYLDDSYIGVIYKNEEQKRRNYGLQDEEQNLIMKYDPKTQEREIIFRTHLGIERIFKEGQRIFFEADGEKYMLDNF